MILPIGHEESKVRRLPWVTFGLMAIFTLVYIATPRSALEELIYPESTLEDAADYWLDHPYLTADPEVMDEVMREVPVEEQEDYLAIIAEQAEAWRGDEPKAELGEQMELERLTDFALGRQLRRGADKNPYRRFGLVPAQPRLYAFLTHIFMHAGWLHLFGNLFMLFLAGPAVEDRWGRPLFSGFFLLSGLLAGAFFLMMSSNSLVPLVGASGAIAGVLGAFLVLYAKTKIRFAYFFLSGLRPVRGTFEAAAWMVLPLWVANELFQGWFFSSLGVGDGIAYWAHVGGFVAGAGMAFGIVRSGLEEQYIHKLIEAKITHSSVSPALERALALREQGKTAEAMGILAGEVESHPEDHDLLLAYWDAASACGQPAESSGAMLRLVRSHARGGNVAMAVQFWLELLERVPAALADPDTLLRMIPELVEGKHSARVVQAFRQMVDSRNSGVTPGLALRILDRAKELDPPSALRAAEIALQSPQMDPSKRERIEQQVAEMCARGIAPATDWEPADDGSGGDTWTTQEAIELAPDPMDDLLKPAPRAESAQPVVLELSADGDLDASQGDGTLANLGGGLQPDEPMPAVELLAEDGSDAISAPGEVYELIGDAEELPVQPTLPPLVVDTSHVPRATAHTPKPTSQLPSLADSVDIADDGPGAGTGQPELPPPVPSQEAVSANASDPSLTDIEFQVLDALSDSPRFSSAKVVEATPTQLGDNAVYFELPGKRKSKLEYAQIQGIAVAAVEGLSERAVVVIDLLLNWTAFDQEILRVVRFRSNAFNPRHLADPPIEDAGEAFRWLVGQLVERSGGTALPSPEAARGRPFQSFADMASYEREVLDIEGS